MASRKGGSWSTRLYWTGDAASFVLGAICVILALNNMLYAYQDFQEIETKNLRVYINFELYMLTNAFLILGVVFQSIILVGAWTLVYAITISTACMVYCFTDQGFPWNFGLPRGAAERGTELLRVKRLHAPEVAMLTGFIHFMCASTLPFIWELRKEADLSNRLPIHSKDVPLPEKKSMTRLIDSLLKDETLRAKLLAAAASCDRNAAQRSESRQEKIPPFKPGCGDH